MQELQKCSERKTSTGHQIQKDELVLLREDNIVLGCWFLRRVTKVDQGYHQIVGAVTVRVGTTLAKRSFVS